MEREPHVFEYEIEANEKEDVRRELFKRLAAKNWPIVGLRTSELTLEDIFLKITMGEGIEIKPQAAETKADEIAVQEKTAATEEAAEQSATEATDGGDK